MRFICTPRGPFVSFGPHDKRHPACKRQDDSSMHEKREEKTVEGIALDCDDR
jgi:hypothetical protein